MVSPVSTASDFGLTWLWGPVLDFSANPLPGFGELAYTGRMAGSDGVEAPGNVAALVVASALGSGLPDMGFGFRIYLLEGE